MTIANIRPLLEQIKTDIYDINYTELIVDDSQLVKFLRKINKSDNNALFFVIPEHTHRGSDDATLTISTAQVLVLNKTSDKISHQSFLDTMQNTEQTILALKDWMIDQKQSQPCGPFSRLIDSSFIITPVWELVACHGHSITFNVEF